MAWDYSQGTDPGAVGAGKTWYNTSTGDIKIRNKGNTQWTNGGNTEMADLGLVPALVGFAAEDAHDFPTSVKKGGVELATSADLAQVESGLLASIGDRISEAISGMTNTLQVADYVASKYTYVNVTSHTGAVSIVLSKPTYRNGRTASDAECTSIISFLKIYWASGQTQIKYRLRKKTETTYELTILDNADANLNWVAEVGGLVIAVRK